MNEQDFMNKINEHTKEIPIPDSISPENMKKMLDENVGKETIREENNGGKKSTNTNRNRVLRRVTAAACITLCLFGGVAAVGLNRQTSDKTETAMETEAVEPSSEDELVQPTSLHSPSSYEDYYETLTAAYQQYYDTLATVTNDSGVVLEVDVADATDAVVMEESADMSVQQGTGSRNTVSSASATSKDKEFSSTNTQEQDVDEGDIIKTDGEYIYKVGATYNTNTGYTDKVLYITNAQNGDLKIVSSIPLGTDAATNDDLYMDFQEFYLYEDYLLLLYNAQIYKEDTTTTETRILIYNVKDKENPKQTKTLTQSGWYQSSRISDGFLYTISNFNETNLDTPTPYTNYIPCVNGTTVECSDIYYPSDILMQTTYVVTSLDLEKPTDFTDSKAIPSNGGDIYVSDSSIYFFRTMYNEVTQTELIKVCYDKGRITAGESATIAGYLYDSFALSEYNGYLRIVATIPANNISLLRLDITPTTPAKDATFEDSVSVKEDVNVIYILDDQMHLTGKLSGIAPGEQIYSARFMGDIAYFVTFKNVDPLFSVDLSDPSEPKIIGQLKIPGFSNYLHNYDNGLLLGFGEEIDANTSDFLGLKLSMFDVSNPADVTEQDKYIIEDSEYSEAQYNHKAMLISPEKNIVGFVYSAYDDVTYEYSCFYATYTYDKEEGFIETAKYEITDDSRFDTDAVRGIYINDYLYLTTNKEITSYKIGSTDMISKVSFR